MTEAFPTPPPPQISPEQLEAIRAAQVKERLWWEDTLPVASLEEIKALLDAGEAVHIVGGEAFRISESTPPELNVLRRQAASLLTYIAHTWHAQITDKSKFLVITSLARTTDYQAQLQERGYPALPDSSHTKLVAFDIATKWFADNDPACLEVLNNVLGDLIKTGLANVIWEPSVGIVHVAVHPDYEAGQSDVPDAAR